MKASTIVIGLVAIVLWGGMFWFFFGGIVKNRFKRIHKRTMQNTASSVPTLDEYRKRKAC